MKNLVLVIGLLAAACSDGLGVPDDYCSKDCADLWTPSCEQRCGTPEPAGTGGNASTAGAKAGGGGSGRGGGGSDDAGATGATGSGGNGGNGGNGGDAGADGGMGDAGISSECTGNEDCDVVEPRCAASGVCSSCSDDDDCDDRGARSRCDQDVGSDTHGQCVECQRDADCDAEEPQCGDDGSCETCDDDGACEDRDDTPRCDTDGDSDTEGRCVRCVEHLDCDNPTPQCNADHECEGCDDDDACEDREDTEVCDTDGDSDFEGTCVECTPTSYDCGTGAGAVDRVCDSFTRECSSELEESADACQSCVSDAQCQDGRLCVRQTFDDPTDDPDEGDIDVGWFCTWRVDAAAGPDGVCQDEPPYVTRQNGATSLDGEVADVCVLARSTCEAFADFGETTCALATVPSVCGHPDAPHDGLCMETGDPGIYKCTVPCLNDGDCEVGSTCDAATNPDTCSF